MSHKPIIRPIAVPISGPLVTKEIYTTPFEGPDGSDVFIAIVNERGTLREAVAVTSDDGRPSVATWRRRQDAESWAIIGTAQIKYDTKNNRCYLTPTEPKSQVAPL